MISTLSNLADRNFVLGFFLPVVLAGLVTLGLFQDLPQIAAIWTAVANADAFAKLTLLVLALWTAAVLLLALNHPLYRLMEGYWGPFLWIGLFVKRQQKAFDDAQSERTVLRAKVDDGPDARREYVTATRVFHQTFPGKRHLVLPTRLGNVIRAFETYSLDVYGVDSIPGWLRLSGVIPDSYSKLIENARAEVDFFLNNCLLFALIAIGSLLSAVLSIPPYGFPPDEFQWHCLLSAIATGLVSWGCYRLAVLRAPDWGDLVRSAFDLYLPELVRKLGYELPATAAERLDFWDSLNSMFLYNTPVDPKTWSSKEAALPLPDTNITIIATEIGTRGT